MLEKSFGVKQTQAAVSLYPFSSFSSPWNMYRALSGDFSFSCPTRQTARWATAAGMETYVCVSAAFGNPHVWCLY